MQPVPHQDLADGHPAGTLVVGGEVAGKRVAAALTVLDGDGGRVVLVARQGVQAEPVALTMLASLHDLFAALGAAALACAAAT